MNIGIIGTGSFARQHAEVLIDLGLNLVGCYGTNKDKTLDFSREFKCQSYSSPSALISSNSIDGLYIVIPPFAHDGNIELQAIERNIPFLCEKPIGLNLNVCKAVAQQINQTNLITSSGYLLRYEPLFEKIKEIIDRNHISTVRINSYSYMPEVHWWRKTALSGGMMVESGCHYIDILRYLFGEITSVAAMTSTGLAKNNIANCDLYDSMEAIFKFESGMIGSIGVTHLLNDIQARTDELQIIGMSFSLKIDLYKLRYQNEAVAFYKETGDQEWQRLANPSSKKELLTRQSKAFVEAVRHNSRRLIKSTYADSLKTLEVALSMNDSAELI